MTHFAKTVLLMGVSVLALSACSGSGKGPGELGSKDDIVVHNNGLPGAQQPQTTVAENGISSTVENVTPNPAAAVDAGEALAPPQAAADAMPSTDPAVDAAAQNIADQKAPVPSTVSAPMNDSTASSTAPATTTTPENVTAPVPVQQTTPATPPVAPVATTTPAPTTAPVEAPVYSAAVSAAPARATDVPAGTPVTAAPVTPVPTPTLDAATINLTDPAVIKSAQAALRLKGAYKGPETGVIDSEFLNALTVYQAQNKLPVGGINAETLRNLGIVQ